MACLYERITFDLTVISSAGIRVKGMISHGILQMLPQQCQTTERLVATLIFGLSISNLGIMLKYAKVFTLLTEFECLLEVICV